MFLFSTHRQYHLYKRMAAVTSGQDDHPHIQGDPFTPHPQQQRSPSAQGDINPIPIDIDDEILHPVSTIASTMPTLEEMQNLAAAQAAQLERANEIVQQQQQQMIDAQAAFDAQQRQLEESARQMERQQETINQLSSAFSTLTTTTASTPSRKKPDMPPFDQQNVLIWLKRLQAAYDRANVTLAKDKFAYLESTFDITFNPIINNFLFNSNNTDDDWKEFVEYMKQEYGPTRRQKARKLIGDLPRQGMKPSQYMAQLEEEVKDVTLDDVKKEHLLKTIPPRIREILGKAVETKTAKEVAKLADDYFDSQGRPLEKSATTISHVDNQQSSTNASASTTFTSAFEDDSTDINFVRKPNFKGRQRSQSRPRFSSNSRHGSNAPAATTTSSFKPTASNSRQQQSSNGLCRFHRMFGDNATKCVSDCPRHSSFLSKQKQQGNATGGRRL